MAIIHHSFWRIPAARSVLEKADWAVFQTGEQERKNTIICVDEDEALVIRWAIAEFIDKHAEEEEKWQTETESEP